MNKLVIVLLTLSVCFGAGKFPNQLKSFKETLQEKYQVYSPEDISKLKKSSKPNQRTASRDMEDLVGDWIMEDENVEFLITVGTDQSILNPLTLMAMEEADGSVTATTDNFTTELTYMFDSSFMNSDSSMSRNTDALGFAQDYVDENSEYIYQTTFDLESEYNLVIEGDSVSGGLGGNDPENCEINWPEDVFKMAVYSFVSEYVLEEGASVDCFLNNDSLDQNYIDFVEGMEYEWYYGSDDEDEDGPEVLIMNLNLMDFFMLMFGMDLDSLNVENPTALGIGSSTDSDTIDMVFGMVFVDTSMIELMADSAEAVASVSVDTLDWSITFNNLSLYDSTGTAVMTVNGTIGPGMIDFVAGVETSLNFFQGGGDEEFDSFISFYDDSTGMEIEVFYDEYYGEEMADSSYFDWSATTDSLFMYFEGDDYYEEEADTLELEYYTSEDSLFMGGEFDPCEEEGFDSYEECFEYMGEDMPGLNELVDVESFYVSMERFFLASEMTAIEPGDGNLPGEFKLYAAYPNPFNPVTTIRFDVGEASYESTLRIFDISGRNVATLINGHLESGTYEVKWDARGFASGIYFSELVSGQNRHTQKMVLLK